MSAIISPLGVISGPIAEHFDITITQATATFTYLTSGVLVGTVVAIFIFDFFRLKHVVAGGVAIICCAIYCIYAIDTFAVLALALGLIGACCGIELSAAAVVITKTYETKLRASMLLLTDSFYSIAGVSSTVLAGIFLARELHWSSAYLLAFVVSFCIAILAITSSYPATAKQESDPNLTIVDEAWPLGVHLIGVAMLVYLIGFVSIYSWVPNYAQATFDLGVEASSQVVSRFFLGLFVGQLLMFFLVLKFSLQKLIIVYALMATLLTISLWLVETTPQLQIAMLILGLASGGLFKTVLTYGTTLVKSPSPKMVSYLIFHAGLGTAIAPFISSFIVEHHDMRAALQFATICYALMIGLILAARFFRTGQAQPSMA